MGDGNYLEALTAFNGALDAATRPETRHQVLLMRAELLAGYLDAPEAARASQSQARRLQGGDKQKSLPLLPPPVEMVRSPLKQIPTVRVLLEDRVRSVRFDALGLTLQQYGKPIWSGRNMTLVAQGNDLRLSGGGSGGVVWRGTGNLAGAGGLAPDWKRALVVQAQEPIRLIMGRERPMRVRGTLHVIAREGRLMVINHLDMEAYLVGVVASETVPGWPLETLKAEAVASRTLAFYHHLHRQSRAFDLHDDERSQRYHGVSRETLRIRRAVMETNGQVLVTEDKTGSGRLPLLALFSPNSGGKTADAKGLYGLDLPYLRTMQDPASLKGRRTRWNRSHSRRAVLKALQKAGIKLRQFKALIPERVGPGGRLQRVRIVTEAGDVRLPVRPLLTESLNLPGTPNVIVRHRDRYIFRGGGWGAGLGMMQWGAAVMAKEGKGYAEILGHYYPGSRMVTHWGARSGR